MHVEAHVKKLKHRAWEGSLVGYSMDSKSFRIYNPNTKSVRESRNVISSRRLRPCLTLTFRVVLTRESSRMKTTTTCFETCETMLSTKTSVRLLLIQSSETHLYVSVSITFVKLLAVT